MLFCWSNLNKQGMTIPSILIASEFDVFRVRESRTILNSIPSMFSLLKGFAFASAFSLQVNGITFSGAKENTIYRLIYCNPGISLDLGFGGGRFQVLSAFLQFQGCFQSWIFSREIDIHRLFAQQKGYNQLSIKGIVTENMLITSPAHSRR